MYINQYLHLQQHLHLEDGTKLCSKRPQKKLQ